MSKNIYSFFNKTSGELPQAEPLNETEVNRYMKEFRNRTNTEPSSRRLPFMYKSVIAASLALVMAIGGTIGYNHFSSAVEHTQPASPFVMTVNAEEITPNETLFSNPLNYGLMISDNDNGDVVYRLDLKLECKGDNIKSITYTIDKDTIGIVYDGDLNPAIGGTPAESANDDGTFSEDAVKKAYTSVTFDYVNQNPEGFSFEIFGIGDSTITANKEALFSYEHLEEKCEQLNNLIGNTIHCTAEYNDGTTVEQDIKIGATISTFSETFPDEYNALPKANRPEKDYRDVFVTFTAAE